MTREIEIPEGYEAKIVGNKVIFELKESEDERIRKALIQIVTEYFSNNINVISCQFDEQEFLAYLEKQKEQKPIPIFKIGDKIKLKSESKYPYREIVDIKDGAYYFDRLVHLPFERQEDWEKEQKPAEWSEEDEDAIGMAVIALEDMYDKDEPLTTYGGHNLPFNVAAERLKSLRPQPHTVSIKNAEKFAELEYERGVKDGLNYHSEEQDSISERFAKIVRENITEISKDAQKQFEQLYFEITGTKMYGGYND